LANGASTFEITIPSSRGTTRFVFSNCGNLDHIASFIGNNGLVGYETRTPSVFVCLAQQAPGLMLDIGANTRIFTLLAAAANPGLRVSAFEPLESVRGRLHANIAHNPDLAARIAVEPFALSHANGRFPFFERSMTTAWSRPARPSSSSTLGRSANTANIRSSLGHSTTGQRPSGRRRLH
jgi:FkbM family methyltransferase